MWNRKPNFTLRLRFHHLKVQKCLAPAPQPCFQLYRAVMARRRPPPSSRSIPHPKSNQSHKHVVLHFLNRFLINVWSAQKRIKIVFRSFLTDRTLVIFSFESGSLRGEIDEENVGLLSTSCAAFSSFFCSFSNRHFFHPGELLLFASSTGVYNLLLLPATLLLLYEVRPPMPSNYINEIRLIKE